MMTNCLVNRLMLLRASSSSQFPSFTISRRSYFDRDLKRKPNSRPWFSIRGSAKSEYPRSGRHEKIPGVDLNLQERLEQDIFAEEFKKRRNRVNIGLPPLKTTDDSLSSRDRRDWRKKQRQNKDLEKAAREKTLVIDVEDVKKDIVESHAIYRQIYAAADLYGIFEDLFPGSYFFPRVHLNVNFDYDDEYVTPVYRGNLIKPSEAKTTPEVTLDNSDPEKFYTLIMVTPDGHFKDENKEYLHWMVANVKDFNNLSPENTVCDYLRPFPPFGAGYFRYVFVLFQHDEKIDFSAVQRSPNSVCLDERTHSTSQFLNDFENKLIPVGLSFFQSDYDSHLRDFYHQTLNMEEPRYEYDFIPPYVKPWNQFYEQHNNKGFNLFLEKHRDPKAIQKEVLTKKLKEIHPFKGDLRTDKYPLLHLHEPIDKHPYEGLIREPSWRRREIEREKLRQGTFKDMDWNKLRYDPTDSQA